MALKEGLRRVNKLGRVLGTTGALLMLFAFVVMLLASRFPDSTWSAPLGELVFLGFCLVLAGIAVATIGWIGEGFAAKGDSKSGPE